MERNHHEDIIDLDQVEKYEDNIDENQDQPVYDLVEIESMHRRNSINSNDDENEDDKMSIASIEREHTDHVISTDLLLIDEIKDLPIVHEIDMSELFEPQQNGQNSNWQNMAVEIVREAADADELVKEDSCFMINVEMQLMIMNFPMNTEMQFKKMMSQILIP